MQRLVDGGPRQAEHDLGGEAVAELAVDVVGAEHALGQLGPRVGVLVGEPGAAEHGRPRPCLERARGSLGRGVEGLAHDGLDQLVALAHQRRADAVVAVDGLEVEAALVAQPALVDRVDVDAEVAHEPVRRRLHRDPAADRARRARRLDLLEVPGPGLEAVRRWR